MNLISTLARYRDLILPVSIIACIGVILVPLPSIVMDVLLAANITIAVIVLLTTIYIKTPLEFNVFPSLLVATTLARLVLNVATTRLILTEAGTSNESAAGGMIRAFGDFVSGEYLEVGIVIFAIIVLIQFLVITKGASRISEVAARFALDGMPGRQMAIDADLNAGNIDKPEAQRRRREVTQRADFYGAMDGASKFVRGDAVAGIAITAINIVGGLYIGMIHHDMAASEAYSIFTRLTIGDGLVSQIPAFLISLAAAFLVTRSTEESNLPTEFLSQLFARPQALAIAGVFLALLILTELPKVPLLVLATGCIGLALLLTNQEKQKQAELDRERKKAAAAQASRPGQPEDYLGVDPLRIEIGAQLLALAAPQRGGDLMEKITVVRTQLAKDMGFLLPKVRLKDNLALEPTAYEILVSGNLLAAGNVYPDQLLAINTGRVQKTIEGMNIKEPAHGRNATWITPEDAQLAIEYGYQVLSPAAVIAEHLHKSATDHADELLTRDMAKQLVDQLQTASPAVVEELIPDQMKLAEVQTILQMLLRENVPIRQLGIIFETLGDYSSRTNNPVMLLEHVRNRLTRTLCQRFSDSPGRLYVVAMDPSLESRIADCIEYTDGGMNVNMSPQSIDFVCDQITSALASAKRARRKPSLLVSPRVRFAVREITRAYFPELPVLSHSEIAPQIETIALGTVADAVAVA